MSVREGLAVLISELDRYHDTSRPDYDALYGGAAMFDFVTAENGYQRHFTGAANTALTHVARALYDDHKVEFSILEFDRFHGIARQCVANVHALGGFENTSPGWDALKELLEEIKVKVAELSTVYTHYFQAWTHGMETEEPFKLGPVTFSTKLKWLDTVDFPDRAKELFKEGPEVDWKAAVKDALERPKSTEPLPRLATEIYRAIRDCPSILGVTITGYEKDLSRKHARSACKAALDSVSLLLDSRRFFHQQALRDERLNSYGTDHLIETDGYLWLPGKTLSDCIGGTDYKWPVEHLGLCSNELKSFASIISGLVEPKSHAHPMLAQRWATALNWYAEGQREQDDAIALTKVATCLDVLSCNGMQKNISNMVSHLLKVDLEKEVVNSRPAQTLRQVVKRIYDHGRSRILHGTHADRFESFVAERQNADTLGRWCLIECALRLSTYAGPDTDLAFRDMPDRPLQLWAIRQSNTDEIAALVESRTPTDACNKAGVLLKLTLDPVRPLSTKSGQWFSQQTGSHIFHAVNVTDLLMLDDANRLNDPAVISKISGLGKGEEFIAVGALRTRQ